MLALPRMELRHLRYFKAVAETLSFSRAAGRLRIAQSAVSRQIAALEAELGAKLLVRSTSRVRLTEAGRHFHGEVERLLAQLAIAVTRSQEISRGRGGELRLGSDWRILLPRLSETVVGYRAANPGVAVSFVELPVHEQIDALRDERIHLAFVSSSHLVSGSDLGTQALYTADMKAVVSIRHPLAEKRTVALRDLRRETWVRLDEKNHPGYRPLVTSLCRSVSFTPRFGPAAQSIEGMLALVATGDGICLIPVSVVTRPNPGLRFLDTDCPPLEFHAAWLKDAPSVARSQFLRLLRQNLSALQAPAPAA